MHQPPLYRHTQLRRLVTSVLVMLLLGGLFAVRTSIVRSAAQESLTPGAYLPLIVKVGPSAPPAASVTPTRTATTTPTATATATVTQTPPCNSVYPIGINASLLNDHGFVPPTNPAELLYYGLYSDGVYTNKTQRRLLQQFPADYLWLAWQPGSTLGTFSAALTGTGTLYQGFDEVVPWPDPGSPEPPGYPLYPHQLTPGDWIQIFQGIPDTMQGRAALDNP